MKLMKLWIWQPLGDACPVCGRGVNWRLAKLGTAPVVEVECPSCPFEAGCVTGDKGLERDAHALVRGESTEFERDIEEWLAEKRGAA